MNANSSIRELLQGVRDGSVSLEEAEVKLKAKPFEDIGYAHVDLHRHTRQGASEVVYGEGKTADQIVGIVQALQRNGQDRILVTRVSAEKADGIAGALPGIAYDPVSRTALLGGRPEPDVEGYILVATAGTSDLPVAEEAAITAEMLGCQVMRVYDVGVAGLHRTLAHTEDIMGASTIIAVAGMEGALASVIGGMAACPVIAVPTSVGYGTAFGGITALLAMLNSCASGVTVVNIDNGFGAGFAASKILHA